MEQDSPKQEKDRHSYKKYFQSDFSIKREHAPRNIFVSLLFIGVSIVLYFSLPPDTFPVGETIVIEEGMPLGKISQKLEEKNIIASRTIFELCIMLYGGDTKIMQGPYIFSEPENACKIASRFSKGESGVPLVRITIPEGTSNQGIAVIAEKNLSQFDNEAFLLKAESLEGYLFPETYFFSATVTEDNIISAMRDEFRTRIKPFEKPVKDSQRTLNDIIIMASILEKEAKTSTDQAIVAGILWKRIEIGMPLQVDAPFYYLLGKTSAEVTQSDLRMDSPYNTYKNKGLPIGPIGNPGEGAIRAAIFYKKTPYLYYLSDKNNVIHYAATFEEHKKNKAKYLR
ncbi:MAG: endolytic transglycosylase MltG [Patescibacteria group bacterium]